MPPERKTGSRQPKRQPKPKKPKPDAGQVERNAKHPNLLAGGVPGNRGGTGVKNRIRELSLTGHATVLANLLKKSQSTGEDKLTNGELIALLDKLGKYGVGTKTEISIENAHFAALVVEIALKHMPEESWDAFRAEVKGFLGDQ